MCPHNLIVTLLLFGLYYRPAELWNEKYLTSFVQPLYTVLHIQEQLWFLSEELDTASSENLQEFIVSLSNFASITQTVLTNRTDIRIISTNNMKNSLGLIFTTGPDDFVMTVHDKVMLRRHFYLNIIIMVHPVRNFSVVERFVHDMWQRNFVNTLLYYQTPNGSNEMYGYTIYPRFQIQNRSDYLGFVQRNFAKFRTGWTNTDLFEFSSPLRQDLPHVFHTRSKSNRIGWQGTTYKVIQLFIDYINATLKDYPMASDRYGGEVIDMRAALDLVRQRKISLLVHAYALYEMDDDIDKSYPIMVVRWCLMVPIWNSVSTFYYPVQPFNELVWYIWASSFVWLLLMDAARILLQRRQLPQSSDYSHSSNSLAQQLRECVLNDFCLVINMATSKNLSTPSTVRFLVFAAVFFHGFFLSANYTSLLGSILTVTLFRAQINTMDDLIYANISVMIIDYELEFLYSSGNNLSHDFVQLLRPVDVATFERHQTTLNSSFAYFVTDDKWHFLALQQRHLKQGLFKLTDICFGSYHLAYPMPPDSPFWRNLEYFLYRVHSSGMLQYYESTAFDHAVHADLVQRYTESSEYTSAGMQHLLMVFMLLLFMHLLSLFIFIGECLAQRLKKPITRRSI